VYRDLFTFYILAIRLYLVKFERFNGTVFILTFRDYSLSDEIPLSTLSAFPRVIEQTGLLDSC
jgi:hypothetical protein